MKRDYDVHVSMQKFKEQKLNSQNLLTLYCFNLVPI